MSMSKVVDGRVKMSILFKEGLFDMFVFKGNYSECKAIQTAQDKSYGKTRNTGRHIYDILNTDDDNYIIDVSSFIEDKDEDFELLPPIKSIANKDQIHRMGNKQFVLLSVSNFKKSHI